MESHEQPLATEKSPAKGTSSYVPLVGEELKPATDKCDNSLDGVHKFSNGNLETTELSIRRKRKHRLCSRIDKWMDKVEFLDDESYSIVKEMVINIGKFVKQNAQIEDIQKSRNKSKTVPPTIKAHAPNLSKAKDSGKQVKSGKELVVEDASKGGRFCHGCLLRGQGHDVRTCPGLKAKLVTEDASKGGRFCHGCNLRGQGHDVRTCPVLKAKMVMEDASEGGMFCYGCNLSGQGHDVRTCPVLKAKLVAEDTSKNGRFCHGCYQRGQGHDARSCPVLKATREKQVIHLA